MSSRQAALPIKLRPPPQGPKGRPKDRDRTTSSVCHARLDLRADRAPRPVRRTAASAWRALRALLVALGQAGARIYCGKDESAQYDAPTPRDFGQLLDYMERRDLKGARKQWPNPGDSE